MERLEHGMHRRHATREELAELAQVKVITQRALAMRRRENQKAVARPVVESQDQSMKMAQQADFRTRV